MGKAKTMDMAMEIIAFTIPNNIDQRKALPIIMVMATIKI